MLCSILQRTGIDVLSMTSSVHMYLKILFSPKMEEGRLGRLPNKDSLLRGLIGIQVPICTINLNMNRKLTSTVGYNIKV